MAVLTLSVFGVGSPVPVARLWVGRGTSGSPLPPTSVRGARRSIGRRAVMRSLCSTWRRTVPWHHVVAFPGSYVITSGFEIVLPVRHLRPEMECQHSVSLASQYSVSGGMF